MKIDLKNLPKGQIELTIEITPQEYEPFLKEAAFKISETAKITGFRPGKAPYDVVKQHAGEAKIWEEALEPAIKKTLIKAINEKSLPTIGSPKIDLEKLAPGNPIIYKATLSILPQVELADYKKLSIKKEKAIVPEEKINQALSDLRKLRAKETLVNRPAKEKDKVDVDFTAYLDSVPLEGGAQKKFNLVIGENMFIPDFEKNLIGLKEGDAKEFKVKFPESYHQKNLANRQVDFKAKINGVYEIELPEPTDEFAKGIGNFKTMDELKNQLRENLNQEAEHKARHELEEKVIDQLITKSTFGDIPELLINSEVKKMIQELEHNIQSQGLNIDDYFKHIKKNRAELMLDFTPQAIKRIKGALVTREVAKCEKIEATDQEVAAEIKMVAAANHGNPDLLKNVNTADYRYYIKNILTSKKVMDFLTDKMAK